MKTLISFSLALLLLAPAAHAQHDTTDTAPLQTILLLDGTSITATIASADDSRYTVVTPTGQTHTFPKDAVKQMGPVGTIEVPTRPGDPLPVRSQALRSDMEHNWDIRLVSGERIDEVGLAGLRNDSLVVHDSHGERSISPANLASMRRDNGGHFWTGAAIAGGALALPALAVVIAPQHRDSPGLQYFLAPAGIIVGALVGGVIGAFFKDTDEFDFMMLEEQQKALGAERMVEFDRQ